MRTSSRFAVDTRRPEQAGGPVLLVFLLGLTGLAGIGEAQDAGTGEPPAARVAAHLHVEIDRGAVTVSARDVAVRDLLAAVALAGGLEVDLDGPLDGRVTLELDRLPMLDALRRVLSGRNFALRYVDPSSGAGRASGARAGKLWIFSGGPEEARRTRADGGAELVAAYQRLARQRPGLASDDGRVRLAAVSELADSPPATAALAAAALFDADAAVREEAIYALGAAGGETGLRILEQALLDPARKVRRAAVEAIADMGGDDAAWALAAALRDEDAALREKAVHALGDVGGEAAVAVLRQALADAETVVRKAALEVLDELSGEE